LKSPQKANPDYADEGIASAGKGNSDIPLRVSGSLNAELERDTKAETRTGGPSKAVSDGSATGLGEVYERSCDPTDDRF
jgi:hypothetical protein